MNKEREIPSVESEDKNEMPEILKLDSPTKKKPLIVLAGIVVGLSLAAGGMLFAMVNGGGEKGQFAETDEVTGTGSLFEQEQKRLARNKPTTDVKDTALQGKIEKSLILEQTSSMASETNSDSGSVVEDKTQPAESPLVSDMEKKLHDQEAVIAELKKNYDQLQARLNNPQVDKTSQENKKELGYLSKRLRGVESNVSALGNDVEALTDLKVSKPVMRLSSIGRWGDRVSAIVVHEGKEKVLRQHDAVNGWLVEAIEFPNKIVLTRMSDGSQHIVTK